MEPDPAPSLLSSTHPSAPPLPPLPVRNNSKLREKGKKEEGRNLREFVDAAYKMDPRVAKKKEDERLERCVLAHACCGLICGWNGACLLMPAVASCAAGTVRAFSCLLWPHVRMYACCVRLWALMHIWSCTSRCAYACMLWPDLGSCICSCCWLKSMCAYACMLWPGPAH